MIRLIFKQIIHRRKSNVWLCLELLLVFCLLWYIVDYFFVLTYNYSLTSHRDIRNTYVIDMGLLNENHRHYVAPAGEQENLDNFYRVVNRIKQHPDVEKVGLAFGNSTPGSLGQNTRFHRSTEDTTRIALTQFLHISNGEDYFGVFGHTHPDGKPASNADFDQSDPGNVVITRLLADKLFPGQQAMGKTIQVNQTDGREYRVSGVLDDLKRFDYLRPVPTLFIARPVEPGVLDDMNISVRVKPGVPAASFAGNFKKQMSSELEIGNFYLKNVSSYEHIMKRRIYQTTNTIRTHTGMMLFFLVNVFLCIIGTFWYRIHVRMEEIGLRRVLGSTEKGIRRLLLAEGMLLLLLVVPVCLILESQAVMLGLTDTIGYTEETSGMYLPDKTVLRFILTNGITFLIMAGVILFSIWLPSIVLGKIQPAIALRDE